MTVRRYDGVAAVPAGLGPTVVTVGMFDGVHRGHRALLDRVAAEAAARGVPAAAVTFDRHPLAVLRPGSEPPLLTTLDRKVELLGQAGVEVVLVLSLHPRAVPGRGGGVRRRGAVRRPGRPGGGGGGELPLRPQGGRRPGPAGRPGPAPGDRGRRRRPARPRRPGRLLDPGPGRAGRRRRGRGGRLPRPSLRRRGGGGRRRPARRPRARHAHRQPGRCRPASPSPPTASTPAT